MNKSKCKGDPPAVVYIAVEKFSIATYTHGRCDCGLNSGARNDNDGSVVSESVIELAIVNSVAILMTGTSRRAHSTMLHGNKMRINRPTLAVSA